MTGFCIWLYVETIFCVCTSNWMKSTTKNHSYLFWKRLIQANSRTVILVSILNLTFIGFQNRWAVKFPYGSNFNFASFEIDLQFTNVYRSNFRAKFTIQIFDYRKINTIFSPFSWHWPTFLILRPNLLHYLRKHGRPVKTQARAVMLGFSWWQRLSSKPTWVPRTSQAQKAVKWNE